MNIFLHIIRRFFHSLDEVQRDKAVNILEYEISELEHVFGLLTLGSLVGHPTAPVQLTFDLLPEMEGHLILMLNKVSTARDPISDLVSVFNIE